MPEKSRGHDRTRIWTAIVYPESAPTDWRSILDDQHIEWAESPLHNCDTNATGEVKKPHYHIVLAFDGPKAYDQVIEILAPIHCPAPQKCHALKGAVRYFAHLDNPEKHQYPTSDIVGHGGFDVVAALAPNSAQRYELIREMQAWCVDHSVLFFDDLMSYAATERYEDWFPLLCDSCAFVMREFLHSRRWKADRSRDA